MVRQFARSFQMPHSTVPGVTVVLATSAHRFPRHSHDEFGIGHMDLGAQRSVSGRGVVEAGAGSIITVNPGEIHDGSPIGDGGRSWRMLYISPTLMDRACTDINDNHSRTWEFSQPVLDAGPLRPWFESMFSAVCHQDGAAPLAAEQALLGIAARLLTRPVRQPLAPICIKAALERILDDPSDDITLSELAHIAGLGRFQLLRGFTKATGLTPHAYLVQHRLFLARRLIQQGSRLADAAAGSGFADQSHMTRLFKRLFGITPAVYARAVAA